MSERGLTTSKWTFAGSEGALGAFSWTLNKIASRAPFVIKQFLILAAVRD
jgi:hypothetical protein